MVLFGCLQANAQSLSGFSTKWNDEFTEWDIFVNDEESFGEVKMTWQLQDDWTKWNFQFGDTHGKIIQPWQGDKSIWEVRSFGDIVTCRTAWKDDFTEWRITDNKITLILRTRFGDDPNEWVLRDEKHGLFAIYTTFEHDPRDWTIIDELDEEISLSMKMALVFMAVFHSLPIE